MSTELHTDTHTQYLASIRVVSHIFTYFSICFSKITQLSFHLPVVHFPEKASRETLAQRLRLAADGTFVAESSDELLGAPRAV